MGTRWSVFKNKGLSLLLFIFPIVLTSCANKEKELIIINEIELKSNVRAALINSDNEYFFAGSNGIVGYSNNEGENWKLDSTHIDKEFRSIAYNDGLYLQTIYSPGEIWKMNTESFSYERIFCDSSEKAFYDALIFNEKNELLSLGDAVEDHPRFIIIHGENNTADTLPNISFYGHQTGDAFYAASNGNMASFGQRMWFCSGGEQAKVFRSEDYGRTWKAYPSPIVSGGKMTGIYAIDFYNENIGIAVGGDWEKPENNIANIAITTDGGQTWQLVSDSKGPGYLSSVKFVPNSEGKELFACSYKGLFYSDDSGETWRDLNVEGFYSLRINSEGKRILLTGKAKVAVAIWE